MKNKKLPPIHPGEILIEEFLKPMGISQYRLAKDISVPPRRINEIVHGKRPISADTALRLGRFFGISPQKIRCQILISDSSNGNSHKSCLDTAKISNL